MKVLIASRGEERGRAAERALLEAAQAAESATGDEVVRLTVALGVDASHPRPQLGRHPAQR